jgi:predicted nucleic acid-binding protein
MIVVSDTSPISALIKIQHVHLLWDLFAEVIIPTAVHLELQRAHTNLPTWLRVQSAANSSFVASFERVVDPGEAEAIQLAIELRADRLLIDDLKGRNVAEREGLRAIGLVGVLLLARREKLILSVGDLIERLKKEAHVYLSSEVIEIALRAAGELD